MKYVQLGYYSIPAYWPPLWSEFYRGRGGLFSGGGGGVNECIWDSISEVAFIERCPIRSDLYDGFHCSWEIDTLFQINSSSSFCQLHEFLD